jgi:hypothetical protein
MASLPKAPNAYACEAKFKHIFQLKVTLKGTKPLVWRRIQIPEIYTFWDLHVAISDCMPWADYHLHEFVAQDPTFNIKHRIGIPSDDEIGFDDELPTLPGWQVNIAPYLTFAQPKVEYMYDFGDGWQHSIRLEKILPREKDVSYPRCIGGKRACPPEDCGGMGGYGDLLRTLSDPQHERYEDLLTWVGGSFDPDAFSCEDVHFDDPEKRWRIALGGEDPEPGMRIDYQPSQ